MNKSLNSANDNSPIAHIHVGDPYGGSGTSVVVAQKHGGQGHMIEINSNFARAAKERIERNGYKVFVHVTKSIQTNYA